jgi:hypothetical protein
LGLGGEGSREVKVGVDCYEFEGGSCTLFTTGDSLFYVNTFSLRVQYGSHQNVNNGVKSWRCGSYSPFQPDPPQGVKCDFVCV